MCFRAAVYFDVSKKFASLTHEKKKIQGVMQKLFLISSFSMQTYLDHGKFELVSETNKRVGDAYCIG